MASAERGQTRYQINLRRYLRETGVDRDLTRIICEIANASKYIINAIRTGDLGVAGTSNLYGEEQLELDVLSDRIIQKRLMYSGVIAKMASEEVDEVVEVTVPNNGRYSIAFDPLDGSSLVDVNLAVGTIVSIYEGDNLLRPGRNQVAALYVLYGPRTTMVVSTGKGVHEFAMNQLMEFDLVQENIQLEGPAKIYAPGGLRSKYTKGTLDFVRSLEANGTKLRYSGGFVPDINQVLIKGGGIFLYPHLTDNPQGKLRLLYELNPMAFLVEQAGGAASNGRQRILDINPENLDQCAPVFIGTKDAVAQAEQFIREEEG
ncbi:MAG: class 1 fructose-bisphosphatase [Desulfuromonadales bacterium]|jgi:fructose-1,6-bisphosphatase I|nr:class 1 fructose-bisphosphatase [Desulfuromonadales bacterium]MDH3808339.1 class 1 fructose-bisphosphatase [Desulfuromonadales bacterium]MDH3867978.1 class 1 fructose-bisphosphatase [Desulfuromonadales bacterium]MDH3961004.1 class 1 fructose-bisphosphatase [Desulfuromonadales bacterium]MDH4025818.1 class 1 fructose-bisphosphatase [Desulfuromonadales bacterium]